MQVQIPDFVGGIQRQQALAQQGEMSRLQALALQRVADSEARFNEALAAAGPGLLSGDGATYDSALAALARGGQQGLAMALPLIQQQRSRREALDFWGGGGGSSAPVDVQPAPSGPAVPAGDAEAAAREAARARAALDPNAPDYVERLQAINDRLLLAHGPRGGSTSRTTATTVAAMPGWDDGIPAPGAVTRAPARPVVPAAAPAGGAPAGGRSGVSEAELRRIEMGLAHPNEEIRRQAQSRLQMLQFRLRENGQEPLVEIADPSSPTGRRLVTRAQGAGQPAPGPQGAQGPQPSWYQQQVLTLGPLVANGTATPEQQQQYAAAATLWQNSGTTAANIPDPNNPGATLQVAIPRPLPPGFPAPPTLAAQPAAPQQAAPAGPAATPGASAPTPAAAAPPTPADPNAPRIISTNPGGQPSTGDRSRLRAIEVEASGIKDALAAFREARANASVGERALAAAGRPTALSTAWSNAALLAKGEALYNLGVLNGPDLTIIQRTLTDPATISGFFTGSATVEAQIRQIENLIDQRLAAARAQFGGQSPEQARAGTANRAPAQRALLNGRPIVVRNGAWVFEDSGEAVPQ